MPFPPITSIASSIVLRLTADTASTTSTDIEQWRWERLNTGIIDRAGVVPRRFEPASVATLVPRRGLFQIFAESDTVSPNRSPVDRELHAALENAAAWRMAWRTLRYGGGEGWASPLQELSRLELCVAEQLSSWGGPMQSQVPIPAGQRDACVARQDLLWGVRDGQMLLAWACAHGPPTPLQLARHFGLNSDAASRAPVAPDAAPLTAQERMALSLYSVNGQVQMTQLRPLCRAFHVINAALRHRHPRLQWALQGLIRPLLSGLRRLQAVTEPVMRGLWLPGPDALNALRDRLQPGARLVTTDLWTGSRQAAYPGHVVFRIQPLLDACATLARDTSAFSYASEQREAAFVPGAHFEVLSAEFFEPDAKQSSNLDLSDALTRSSGRSWSLLERQPLLKVSLRELPAVPVPEAVQSRFARA